VYAAQIVHIITQNHRNVQNKQMKQSKRICEQGYITSLLPIDDAPHLNNHMPHNKKHLL